MGRALETLTFCLSVCRPSALNPETSALQDLRSPEKRKQDAYQERLFLFFVTNPLTQGWEEPILPGLLRPAATACSPPCWVFHGLLPPHTAPHLPRLLLLGWSLNSTKTQGSHL